MKVRELIEHLSAMPQDMEVMGEWDCAYHDIDSVRKVESFRPDYSKCKSFLAAPEWIPDGEVVVLDVS